MKILVTGVAGFIGSHLAEALLAAGHDVVGVDAFVDFYPRARKMRNLAGLLKQSAFSLVEGDLAQMALAPVLDGVEAVFHQAAQAGVRTSWGQEFSLYTQCNVLATQRLLEACRGRKLTRFVYASSSSVYGDAERYPTDEYLRPAPQSPYGVTKLAAEHLCCLYARNFGVPTVSLRYFTVYGPRQRPDMAFNRLLTAVQQDKVFTVFGSGRQTRDFTYVGDIVAANLQAFAHGGVGEVFNIGGGATISMNEVFALVEKITGRPVRREHREVERGDVLHTAADTSRARALLGYRPQTTLAEGLAHEWAWLQRENGAAGAQP